MLSSEVFTGTQFSTSTRHESRERRVKDWTSRNKRPLPPCMSSCVAMPPTELPEEGGDELVHSPVLDQMEAFFSEPSFTGAINDFASQHAPRITPLAEGDEHPLEYHAAFMQYTELIESKVSEFLAEHGYTENDIVVAATSAPFGVHTCIEYLLASTEYTAFLQLMADFNSMSEYVVDES